MNDIYQYVSAIIHLIKKYTDTFWHTLDMFWQFPENFIKYPSFSELKIEQKTFTENRIFKE